MGEIISGDTRIILDIGILFSAMEDTNISLVSENLFQSR